MDNCIFCRIIAGEIPSRAIYEDDAFRVILDASPATRGHALILPKKHYADIYELPEDVAADAMKLYKKLAGRMTELLGADGFNLVQNNGEAAGQTVFHYHMHLIPRYRDPAKDSPENVKWHQQKFTDAEYDEIAEKLRAEI